jgi:sarcosine oxidase subunit gamma
MTTPTNIEPAQLLRRSPLYRQQLCAGAQFLTLNNGAVPACYPELDDEPGRAAQLALVDLSVLPRTGFKGSDSMAWLGQHRVQLPPSANLAQLQGDGSLVARLSEHETLILCDLACESTTIDRLNSEWSPALPERIYSLPRNDSHCWLAMCGEYAAQTLAKVCAVDLRIDKFPRGAIAQTSLARINAITLRHDLGAIPCYYILADIAATEFLWDALMDAMQEFNGCPAGLNTLRTLASEPE